MNFTEIILRKLQSCPLLEEHGAAVLGFAGMDAKKRSMSVLNTKGERVIEEYCDGSRDMQFPFALIYRSPELDTAGKLAAQELIDGVADWLTDEENLPIVDGVRVWRITRADTCALISEDEDGATFQGSFALEYFKEE
ncbi:MAG: hypothetical protein NC299_17305 [Lachnospiraceae bacterium]|nr:hypothetical protein [Ruminococcus sp.]MCM1277089.1 hypothetical protein [Lachnospiraceae bacterium]